MPKSRKNYPPSLKARVVVEALKNQKTAAEIAQLPIEIVDADLELTRLAAELRAQYKLPYADCFAAALGSLRKAVVATADRDFNSVKDQVNLLWLKGP